MITSFIGVLFDGVAYGSLLFLISIGLSVTMGLMNFINLAHGAFAMLGGYAAVVAMSRLGIPFLPALAIAFAVSGAVGALLERVLYRRLYRATHLDQVLFTIGLTLMSIATATYFFGPAQQPVRLPGFLTGQLHVLGVDLGTYRLFLIAMVVLATLALTFLVERTRFGAQVRASVDNQRMARGLGIDVDRAFMITFALGGGLAGLGGAAAIEIVGLDHAFALTYLVYVLIVVAVGGLGSIGGSFAAALLLGVSDMAGKYYFPWLGAFVIYLVMVALLMWRPMGLFGKR